MATKHRDSGARLFHFFELLKGNSYKFSTKTSVKQIILFEIDYNRRNNVFLVFILSKWKSIICDENTRY